MDCLYSHNWSQRSSFSMEEDYLVGRVTAPYSPDARHDVKKVDNKPLREKNNGKKSSTYKHVPHRDKPPQVVAKRNARERRRVQAVNSAFVRLRKAIPIQNTRSKRISKVKTLQNAIEYINALEELLQDESYPPEYFQFENNYTQYEYEDGSGHSYYEPDGHTYMDN